MIGVVMNEAAGVEIKLNKNLDMQKTVNWQRRKGNMFCEQWWRGITGVMENFFIKYQKESEVVKFQ